MSGKAPHARLVTPTGRAALGRIDGRLIRRGALLFLFVGGGLLFAACATTPGQPARGPAAAFDVSPTSGNAPLPVTFTDNSTGTITGWQWDFGDTATSTTQSPTHTYDAGGTYTVALTVTGAGGTNTTSKTITVNAPPVVSITAPPDGTISAPDFPMTFTGTATDPEDGDLSSGIQWSSSIDGPLGSGASITTSALNSGTHTITASGTDSNGATGTATITVVVNAPPGIGITAPETGATFLPGEQIQFTANAIDLEDGDLSSSIQWSSSKDGPLGTGASVTSSLSSGAQIITASVTDGGGKTSTESVLITVDAAPSIAIGAPANGASITQGTTVLFSGSAIDAEDGDLSAGIQWTSNQDGVLGTGATISTNGLSVGTHTITASVADSQGRTASKSIALTVTAPVPPVASFSASPSTGTAPLLVSLTDTSTGNITSWVWAFSGGSGGSSGQNVTATFTTPGAYTVTLVVSGPGGTSQATKAITVTAAPPVASFAASPLFGTAPLQVFFVDTSTGSITSQSWTFSDGGSASGSDVTHTFTAPGDYTATLVVSGPGGTSSAIMHIVVDSLPSGGDPPGRTPPDPEKIPG